MLYVVPVPGISVRDPVTYEPVPAVGAWKPRDQFWLRRLADGDVVVGEPPAEPEELETEAQLASSEGEGE